MSPSDRIFAAAAGGALVLAAAAAWLLISPTLAEGPIDPQEGALFVTASAAPSPGATGATGTIVVDVQGAVVAPGIRELPAGGRVADAIAAAGGYAADADLAVASATLNLAQPLADGGQVRVPRLGDAVVGPLPGSPAPAGGGTDGGGLVNLNTATPEELEALPGIGEVTVQKIVAARQERPFASLEEAVERGVLNRGQLEDIQGLATAG